MTAQSRPASGASRNDGVKFASRASQMTPATGQWLDGYLFALRNLSDEAVQADLARVRAELDTVTQGVGSPNGQPRTVRESGASTTTAACQLCGKELPGMAVALFMYCGSCARNPTYAACSCGAGNLPAPWHQAVCPVLTEWLRHE